MKRNMGIVIGLVTAFVLLLGINLIASMLLRNVQVDLTEDNLYTLSEGSKKLLHRVEDPVRIKIFYSKKAANAMPGARQYAERVIELLQQYESEGHGKIRLEVLDPRPDTEVEEAAIRYGLKAEQLPTGDPFYFGLIIENETGDKQTIPFLTAARENLLEYDVSRLVSAVSTPKKKVVGVMSALPVTGGFGGDPMARLMGKPPSQPWAFTQELKNNYVVKDVPLTAKSIESGIDLLIVLHPKGIKPETEYAIDQYLMRGGRAILMVDSLSFVDQMGSQAMNPQQRMETPFDSNLSTLLPSLGVNLVQGAVAGDGNLATKVNMGAGLGEFPNVLTLTSQNLNQEDTVSANMENILLLDPGYLTKVDGALYEMTPLMQTTTAAGKVDAYMLRFGGGDAEQIKKDLKPGNQKLTLAWKITGRFKTAFPSGKPAPDPSAPPEQPPAEPEKPIEHMAEAKEASTVIVIADADMPADNIAVRAQNFLGQTIYSLMNDNLNFVNNAVETLLGAQELIGLRTRGKSLRPFTRVDDIERQAKARWKAEEDQLNASLQDANRKLQELQSGKGEGQKAAVLSASQLSEIEKFRNQQAETKKKLTEVRRNLRQDIEKLGVKLKFINIALVPILIFLFSFVPVVWRSARMKAS